MNLYPLYLIDLSPRFIDFYTKKYAKYSVYDVQYDDVPLIYLYSPLDIDVLNAIFSKTMTSFKVSDNLGGIFVFDLSGTGPLSETTIQVPAGPSLGKIGVSWKRGWESSAQYAFCETFTPIAVQEPKTRIPIVMTCYNIKNPQKVLESKSIVAQMPLEIINNIKNIKIESSDTQYSVRLSGPWSDLLVRDPYGRVSRNYQYMKKPTVFYVQGEKL